MTSEVLAPVESKTPEKTTLPGFGNAKTGAQ